MKSNFSNRLYRIFGIENDNEGAIEAILLGTVAAIVMVGIIVLIITAAFLIL